MKVIKTGFIAIMFLILCGGGRVVICDSLSWIGIDLHEHHHCDVPIDCDSNHDHEEEECDCEGDPLLLQLTKTFPSLDSNPGEMLPLASGEEFLHAPKATFTFRKLSHPPPPGNSGVTACALLQRFTI